MKCRTCDQDNPPEASFCANCGTKLVAEVEPASPSAPSPPQVPRKWLLVGGVAVLVITGVIIGFTLLSDGSDNVLKTSTHKEVTVASMRLDIPKEWQKTEDYSELVENAQYELGVSWQYFPIDVYQTPEEDVCIYLGVYTISKYFEEYMEEEWESWESYLEYSSQDDFCSLLSGILLSETIVEIMGLGGEELTQQQTFQHTIDGYEAVEKEFTFNAGGKTCIAYMLFTFSKNDLGIVFMGGEESAYKKYKETWQEVRDSIKFQTATTTPPPQR